MKSKPSVLKLVVTRSGDVVPFDVSRVERAIEKAAEVAGYNDFSFVDDLSQKIMNALADILLSSEGEKSLDIEMIQNVVEQQLMETGYFDIAKHYIIYRNERENIRKKKREDVEKKLEKKTLKVVKANGKKEKFNIEKVKENI